MPRQSKPFFRQQTQSWYCSINGKQFPLGKNKTEAFEKFYELMGLQCVFAFVGYLSLYKPFCVE
jgi:hypothetical protein